MFEYLLDYRVSAIPTIPRSKRALTILRVCAHTHNECVCRCRRVAAHAPAFEPLLGAGRRGGWPRRVLELPGERAHTHTHTPTYTPNNGPISAHIQHHSSACVQHTQLPSDHPLLTSDRGGLAHPPFGHDEHQVRLQGR
jgi:hypothetical protein